MSDLVGNPEDRFSDVAALIIHDTAQNGHVSNLTKLRGVGVPETLRSQVGTCNLLCQLKIEPRREKTGLRGFRTGPTQTDLYKLRKELEA